VNSSDCLHWGFGGGFQGLELRYVCSNCVIHDALGSRVCSLFDSLNLFWRFLEVVFSTSFASLIGSVSYLIARSSVWRSCGFYRRGYYI